MSDSRSESSTAAELSKVQLAHLDIDPDTLAGSGPGLWDLIGTDLTLDVRAPREQLDVLPHLGWRVVHSRPVGVPRGRTQMLAAPYSEPANTWAVVNLAERDGKWLLSTDPGPLPVYRGRPQRRQALRLSWPDGLTASAGSVPELKIVLTNMSADKWINETGESVYIRAWLLNEGGHRIEKSSSFVFGNNDTNALPDLDTGRSISLPTALATPEINACPPGHYALDAMLVQLNLRSQPGTLTLI